MNVLTLYKNENNRITTLLQKLVFRTVDQTINTLDVLGHVNEHVLGNSGFIAPVAVLVNVEQGLFSKDHMNIDGCGRQFVEASTKGKED